MRTTLKFSIAALAATVAVSACGDARATEAAQDDLKRDLELASSTAMTLATPKVDASLLSSMETKPLGTPEAAKVVKKGAGSRALHSQTPTVRATTDVDVAAVNELDEIVETESIAPVPEPSNEPVAIAPRPQPIVVQTGGSGDYGTSGNGGGVFGGGSGVIIRGGGVDGDDCDLHRGGRRGMPTRGPIYIPTATAPRTGGILVNRPAIGIGIGSRSLPSSGARSAPTRSSPSSGRGVSSPRSIFSPRGR